MVKIRGGYREGSGRKPLDPDKRKVKFTVYLDPRTIEKLRESSLKPGVQIDMLVARDAG